MTLFFKPNYLQFSLSCLLWILMGCESNSGSSTAPRIDSLPSFPPVVIENGFPAEVRLSIQGTINTDTTSAYKLISSYEDKPIGLIIVVPRKAEGKETGSRAFFKSIGAPSDLFLQVLAGQYKQHVKPSAKFSDSIPFICMNLKDFSAQNSTSSDGNNWIAAEYKLFFDSESIDGDAEMFMNIDPDHKWIEFEEKDEDYRSHLIKLFKQH